MSFEQIGDHINQGFKSYLLNQLKKKRILLGIFFALSFINQLIDSAAYIFILVMFSKSGYEYSSVFMMFVNFGFGVSNFVYIGWGVVTLLKLPKHLRFAFLKSLVGFVG